MHVSTESSRSLDNAYIIAGKTDHSSKKSIRNGKIVITNPLVGGLHSQRMVSDEIVRLLGGAIRSTAADIEKSIGQHLTKCSRVHRADRKTCVPEGPNADITVVKCYVIRVKNILLQN
jgi:hypothetical protein